MDQKKGQGKLASAAEAITSSAVGFLLAWAIQVYIVPLIIDAPVSHSQGLAVVLIFTAVSIIRSYGIRRVFNWLHHR